MTLRDLIIRIFPQESIRGNGDGEVSVNCPFCLELVGKKDFKQRLGINTTTGVGHCYRCEFKGGKRYVFRELCRAFGVQHTLDREPDDDTYVPKEQVIKKKKPQDVKLPSEYEPLWRDVDEPIGKKALKYLTSRNVTLEQIRNHRIGFCAVGRYAFRIVFPVVYKKRLVGLVTRDFSGKAEYKYLNSIGDKSLYNVPKKKAKIANMSEGVFDALALERGVPLAEDCLATLGSGFTKQVLKVLLKYDTFVLWPDPDRPGAEGAIKKALKLQKKKKTVLIVLPDPDDEEGDDLGSMRGFEVAERRRQAVPFTSGVAKLLRMRIAAIASPKKKKEWKRNEKVPIQF